MSALSGSTIAILGATGGIGSHLLDHLRASGARAIALGRSPAKLASLAAPSAAGVVVDLCDPSGWPEAVSSLPGLDGLVIGSGRLEVAPFRALAPEKLAESLEINVTAPVMFVRSLLRAGKLNPGCSIVFIGSIAGIRAIPGNLAYAAGKAALHGVVRNLALEMAGQRMRVNMVSPGLVMAGMGEQLRNSATAEQLAEYGKRYPLGLGKPGDVAGPVAFLLSAQSGWITGQDLVADGGATLG